MQIPAPSKIMALTAEAVAQHLTATLALTMLILFRERQELVKELATAAVLPAATDTPVALITKQELQPIEAET
tara:strand:+ start:16470 stop:16688 length:219 start_codon:yes stop_codon:yes gene_type:complete